ncbi:MAG: hypothetical protein WBN22_15115, partial [Verrucomicrobiia bacterium]
MLDSDLPALVPLKEISLIELITNSKDYEGTTFIIDGVNVSGEIKRRQAHPGCHIRIDPGDGEYTYK